MDRRSFLAAAPAAFVLAVDAGADPAPQLARLIDAHRAAWSAWKDACHAFSEAYSRCDLQPERVQYGLDAFTKAPLYASSVAEIERLSHSTFDPILSFTPPARHAVIELKRVAWRDDKVPTSRASQSAMRMNVVPADISPRKPLLSKARKPKLEHGETSLSIG